MVHPSRPNEFLMVCAFFLILQGFQYYVKGQGGGSKTFPNHCKPLKHGPKKCKIRANFFVFS